MSKAIVKKLAPFFKGPAYCPTANGFKNISLDDFKGRYLLFFFYPLNFTFVCPTEIIQFSNKAKEFRKIGCDVLGCSTDSEYSHSQYVNLSR
jgi:alkyl hydroperoxide reductase subunit AhpC